MGRSSWALVKANKNFHVRIYRGGLAVLIVSLILSAVLGFLIIYIYQTAPEPDYYASSGITSPIQLKSLTSPNNSPYALLEPDPPAENRERVIQE